MTLFSSVFFYQQVDAASTTKTPAPINLGNSSHVQIKNAELFTQEQGNYFIYTLTYTNNGNSTLNLVDYWIKVKSISGKTYKTTVVEKDKNVSNVLPNSTIDLTFYSPVDDNAKLSDFLLTIVKWDFSTPDYTHAVGSFKLANGYGAPTLEYQPKYLITKENKLKTAIKSVQTSVDGNNRLINISFLFENLNTRDYRPSKVMFYLVTSEGSIYSAKNDTLKDLIILPKERNIISLQVTLPTTVNLSGLRLLAGYLSETENLYIPFASYRIPKAANNINAIVSQMNYEGYHIELLGYNRLPTDTQDLLTANLRVTNNSSNTQKIPSIKPTWTINGIVQSMASANATAYDKRIQLAPGESIQMVASLPIPYILNLNNVLLSLKETVDEKTEKTIGHFKTDNINQFSVALAQKASFDRLGSKSQVELLRVRSSGEGKLINVSGDLVVTNVETRSTKLQKYGIYLIGVDNQLYPLKIEGYDKTVISNGKIIIPFSGNVPVTVKGAEMKLLFTELLPTAGEGTATETQVPINTVSMTTVWPEGKSTTTFNNLTLGKYDFSFNKFFGYLDMVDYANIQGIKLDFEYNMLVNPDYDDMAGTYKLRFEIEDQESAKATYFKEFELIDSKITDEYKAGATNKKTIVFSDPNLMNKITSFKNYKLSVYCVVNDQKVLLAQKELPYFYIDWVIN
jgi:hypothetical protein